MLKLNLYSKNTGPQDDTRFDVTGHDRFGHVGIHRTTRSSSSTPTFTPSPKWRIQREALLRQQRQAERWRRSSGVRGSGYVLLGARQLPETSAADEENNDFSLKDSSQIKSRSPSFGFSWFRQALQHLLCRSDRRPHETDEPLDFMR